MTITINRPVLKPRLAVGLGLAAILVGAAFAVFQNTQSDVAEVEAFVPSAPAVSAAPAEFWSRLQSLQDNYLAPAVSPEPAEFWSRLQSLQDNYLPPIVKASAAEPPPNMPTDDRTNRPR
ncbi:MAG: hypothetical protein M3P87_02150 [Actinomycetota bacterium]|nr:hypothetical protein [Actinomycetota bacterium]